MISWYIGKRIVGIINIEHLCTEEYKEVKMHPFIGMEGVGDKVEVINE